MSPTLERIIVAIVGAALASWGGFQTLELRETRPHANAKDEAIRAHEACMDRVTILYAEAQIRRDTIRRECRETCVQMLEDLGCKVSDLEMFQVEQDLADSG